jgi:hypothetical protein
MKEKRKKKYPNSSGNEVSLKLSQISKFKILLDNTNSLLVNS